MKIIDSHIHFWDTSNGHHQWVDGTKLPNIVTPDDFNIDNFVHVEAHNPIHNNLCEYTWIKKNFNNKNIKVVAHADFSQPMDNFIDDVIKLSNTPDIVGIRHIMAKTTQSSYSPADADIPVDLFDKLKILEHYNLVFECQMYPNQFLDNIDIIHKSGVTTAAEHFGLPIFASQNNIKQWNTLLNEINQSDNITFKLSGLDLNNDDKYIKSSLDKVLNTITSDKLCYGSNFPVTNSHDYSEWQKILVHSIASDNKMLDDIFFNTANKLYQFSL